MPRQATCACGVCRKCKQRIYMREWYARQSAEKRRAIVAARDPERVRANAQAAYYRQHEKNKAARVAYRQTEAGREAHRRKTAEWAKRNPEKRKAYKAVQNALRKGKLVRPETCSAEGCERKPQAHHEDYSKPLDVLWLCAQHHADHHRGIAF